MAGGDAPSAQAEYLKASVGPVLAKAFAELAIAQPADAIGFLSNWLDTYVEAQRSERAAASARQALDEDRAAAAAERARVAAKLQEIADATAKREAAVTTFQKELEELYLQPFAEGTQGQPLEPFDAKWARLLQTAETLTGIKGIYLAKVQPGETETMTYTMAQGDRTSRDVDAPGHDFLLAEALPKEKGVTWRAFEPKGGEGEGEGEVTEKKYVPLFIKDVIEEDEQMHFYELTRLGSMLAIPMVFPDLVTEAALAEARKFLAEKAKKEQEDEEKRKAAEEAVAAGTEGAEMPPEPEPMEPTDATIPKTGEVKYALCMDTLQMAGDGEKVVEQKHIDALDALCRAVAECKTRYDHFGVWQQAAAFKEEDQAAFKAAKDAAVAKVEAENAAAKESEALKDAKEDEIVLVELEHKFASYKELLELHKDDLLALKQLPIVSEAAHTAVAVAALFCQMPVDQVVSRANNAPIWEKCRQTLPAIVDKVLECAPVGPRVGLAEPQTVASLRQMSAKLPKDDAMAEEPVALQCLYLWVQAALDLREQDVKIRKEKGEAPCDDAGIAA